MTPTLAQTTTFHLMSSETLQQEAIAFAPLMVGGTNFVIDGTLGLSSVGATFHPSSVTAKNRATPQLLKLNGVPGAAVAGMLVKDVTKNSYAFIDSIAASNATMTQPLAGAGLTTVTAVPSYSEDDTWAAADSFQLLVLPNFNLKMLQTSGGGSDTHGATPTAWVQEIHVPDTSGAPGFDTFSPTAINGSQLVLSSFTTDAFFRSEGGLAPFDLFAANVWAPNGAQLVATNAISGAYNTNLSANQTLVDNVSSVDGDAIMHGTMIIKGNPYVICGLAYSDSSVSLAHEAVMLIEADSFASSQLWGPGGLNLEGPMSAVTNATGGTWANGLTLSGGLTIEGAGTGTKYAAGVWTDGINVTAANLDTNNGLQNPRTGSRFSTN